MRLIVFDCDGTLVDSQHVIGQSMARAFELADLESPTLDQTRRIVGLALVEAIARLLPEGEVHRAIEVAGHYKTAFGEIRRSENIDEPLFPSVRETLTTLNNAGYLLAVATGKSQRGLRLTLAHHNLDDHCVTLQTVDDAPGKPHPGMLLNAMDVAGVGPAETAFVGDTVFDIETARNAGTVSVGVSWGYHENHELEAAGAHHLIHHMDDLAGALNLNIEVAAVPSDIPIEVE